MFWFDLIYPKNSICQFKYSLKKQWRAELHDKGLGFFNDRPIIEIFSFLHSQKRGPLKPIKYRLFEDLLHGF